MNLPCRYSMLPRFRRLTRMSIRPSHRLHSFTAFGLVLALLAGCQEDPRLHLAQPDLSPGDAAARMLRVDICDDLPSSDAIIRKVIDAINAERAKLQRSALEPETTLMQIADFYACRLAEGGFFSHVDPFDASTVDSRATSFGYAFLKIGENLAAGQRTAEDVVRDWMESPGHRANILDPMFSEIGMSVKMGGSQGPFWVVEFGRPFTSILEEAPDAPVGPVTTQPIPDSTSAPHSE